MLSLGRDPIGEGAKTTRHPGTPLVGAPGSRVHLGPETLSGTLFGGKRVASKDRPSVPPEEALGLFSKPGD